MYPRVYGAADGMPAEECTGGFCPVGLKTKPGLLWFSTPKGIVVADASPRASDVIAPKALLEEVLLDGALDPAFETRRRSGGEAGEFPAVLPPKLKSRRSLRATTGSNSVTPG